MIDWRVTLREAWDGLLLISVCLFVAGLGFALTVVVVLYILVAMAMVRPL